MRTAVLINWCLLAGLNTGANGDALHGHRSTPAVTTKPRTTFFNFKIFQHRRQKKTPTQAPSEISRNTFSVTTETLRCRNTRQVQAGLDRARCPKSSARFAFARLLPFGSETGFGAVCARPFKITGAPPFRGDQGSEHARCGEI